MTVIKSWRRRCALGAFFVTCFVLRGPSPMLSDTRFSLRADEVSFKRDGLARRVEGRLLTTAADGGLLLVDRYGVLWNIEPQEITAHQPERVAPAAATAEQLGAQLLERLPNYKLHLTEHYVICHGTSHAFAAWTGGVLERLYRGFINYWSKRGLKLHEPEYPLPVILFPSQATYLAYAKPELGDAAANIVSYYNLQSNRVAQYDLTELAPLRAGGRRGAAGEINQLLSRPEAASAVANMVHEATHQIAFNSGMQMRLADVPLWSSEGLAVYFEAPDLQDSKGWRTIGQVHRSRLAQFRAYLSKRPANSLLTLLVDDKRFRQTDGALDAYAEAWALTYYLVRRQPKQYVAYQQMLSSKAPLVWDKAEDRLAQFQKEFGDLTKLDVEFVRYMQKVK